MTTRMWMWRGRVGEFAAELRRRIDQAREAIRVAGERGDPHGLETHLAELEELVRVARRHGLTVDLTVGAGGSGVPAGVEDDPASLIGAEGGEP